MEIQDWNMLGLPLDDTSKENAIIMKESSLWPLLIDPQKQAFKFISNREKSKYEDDKNLHLKVMVEKPGKNIARILENVVRNGATLLVENIGEVLDPAFDTVLRKATFMSGGVKMINIGTSQVQYNDDFRYFSFRKFGLNSLNNYKIVSVFEPKQSTLYSRSAYESHFAELHDHCRRTERPNAFENLSN